jgi:hypothetical protein
VNAGLLPSPSNYVWLYNDALKLRVFLSKHSSGFAVMGDAARLPLRPRIADVTFIVEVSHHLPNSAFRECLAEAARVTRGRLIFIDAVRGKRVRSKLMWQLDLGRHPRTEQSMVDYLDTNFQVESVDRFRGVNHDHVMFVCTPKVAAS